MIFVNRQHAGRLLGEKLNEYKTSNPIVLALPRGGVSVAAENAAALDAPLEVVMDLPLVQQSLQQLSI